MTQLRVILGDQLSHEITALKDVSKDDVILMMEVWDETQYAPHHQKKIAFIFSAMRHFAEALKNDGFLVKYIKLNDPDSQGSFTKTLVRQVKALQPQKIICTEASEYRVLQMMHDWKKILPIPVEIREDQRFFANHAFFEAWAKHKKALRMEFFYRLLRQKTQILMHEDKPIGGRWNYDQENRKAAPDHLKFPAPLKFTPDAITKEVLDLVRQRFSEHIGTVDDFNFAVTRKDALKALKHFITTALPQFGDYQDAMRDDNTHLFHSQLSQYLNIGLLNPYEICLAAQAAYEKKAVPLNAAEGFIRQILGWREFVRGIYWLHMPKYAEHNALNAQAELPSFYWDGNTKMRCMAHVIKATIQHAMSHHIQRLMITGNFALLLGVKPDAVCAWYLAVYADAYEWVELPNTLGMALYGDNGLLASKPYAASGSYINRMSNFCKDCHYKVNKKLGDDACPFNYLYWAFLIKHEGKLKNNMRLKFAYHHLQSLDAHEKHAILSQAKKFHQEIL